MITVKKLDDKTLEVSIPLSDTVVVTKKISIAEGVDLTNKLRQLTK